MPSARDLSANLPWYVKIGAKLVLSRLPLTYRFWRRVGWFRLGDMDNPEYAFAVVKRHFERANSSRNYEGFVALEVGPGDSVCSALIAFAFGVRATVLIDAGRFAREDCEPYRAMVAYLEERGFAVPPLAETTTMEDVLGSCHAQYLTGGLASLRALPKESVDFVWSHHVLERIKRGEFVDVMRELRRILRPDGVCSHSVDLKDGLSDALNNLRFSERVWESPFMARSGFYTNRLRYSEMKDIFRRTGFGEDRIELTRWEELPTPKEKMSDEFRRFSDEDLLVSEFDVILRPE